MAAKSVVLILGAGPRVGASVAEKFASIGYQVALASRSGSGSKTDKGFLSLKADFTKPDSIPALFQAVKTEFHTAPSVVVYNAAALTPPSDNDSALSVSAESVASDLTKDIKKTFIYTGNMLNAAIVPVPMFLDLGMGKSASAFWIGVADATYSAKGYRFFYADERTGDGGLKGMALDGPAHGEFYAQLANHEANVPWQATFVKDKGFVQFK